MTITVLLVAGKGVLLLGGLACFFAARSGPLGPPCPSATYRGCVVAQDRAFLSGLLDGDAQLVPQICSSSFEVIKWMLHSRYLSPSEHLSLTTERKATELGGVDDSGEARLEMKHGRISKKVRQRELLIIARLQQPTLEKAAAAVGISATTAWRISNTAEFQEEYRRARTDAYLQSIGRLQQACSVAATTLLKVMADGSAPAASRVRAADCVFGRAVKGMEIEDIEVRISALEKATKK